MSIVRLELTTQAIENMTQYIGSMYDRGAAIELANRRKQQRADTKTYYILRYCEVCEHLTVRLKVL